MHWRCVAREQNLAEVVVARSVQNGHFSQLNFRDKETRNLVNLTFDLKDPPIFIKYVNILCQKWTDNREKR